MALAALAAGCLDVPDPADQPPDPGDETSLTDGLVGWYEMDLAVDGGDGETGIAPDATGGGDGICIEPACPALVAGRIGLAYEFDGLDDEVVIDDRPALHSDSGTLSVWVYPTATSTMFATKAYGTGTQDSWLLYGSFDGTVGFETADGLTYSAEALALGVWTHLAMTWSPDGNRLYIRGALAEVSGVGTAFDDHPVILGADYDSGDQVLQMKGMLDDVRIYDRVLSEEEITELASM